jgi:hypothetical protein
MNIKKIVDDLELQRMDASRELGPHILNYNRVYDYVNQNKANLILNILQFVNIKSSTYYSTGWFSDTGVTICTDEENPNDRKHKDFTWKELDSLFQENT